jgi:hypothetical protein
MTFLRGSGPVFSRIWFPAAIVFLYLYNFAYFAEIRSANELPRIYLTMAMVDRGAFDIEPEIRRFFDTPDTSSFGGKRYSNKAPGMSLLTVPVYVAQKLASGWETPSLIRMFFWFRLFGATLPSLFFLLLLWRFLGRLAPELQTRRMVLAAYALGTMASTYGTLFIAHQLSSLLLATGFIRIFFYARGEGSRSRIFWAGLASGAGVLVDYQVAFIGPPLFLYLLWAINARRHLAVDGETSDSTDRSEGSWVRPVLLFCGGAALPLIVLMLYQWSCFGSPFKTGYHYLTNPVFREWHGHGFLGLGSFHVAALGNRYFSADDGRFYHSPFLLLAAPGLVLMFRRRCWRAEAIFCAALIAFFIYFAAALAFVSGWDVGPRYITCVLPYYLPPVALCAVELGRRWYLRIPIFGLMAASMIMYLAVNAVFPHYPDNFSNPWFDVTLRFGRAGYLSYNLGWLLGLKGLASIIPYLSVAFALLVVLLGGGHFKPLQRGGILLGSLLLVFALFSFYYDQLGNRRLPVPVRFLPWMEQIWEPRHKSMDLRKLLPEGDPRTGGLKTIK